jgi:uracil phosphoribosyltransferase
VTVVDHPAVAHRMAQLRAVSTGNEDFLRIVGEISGFLAYEAFRDLAVTAITIDTPLETGVAAVAIAEQVIIVPILRAGLGMVPSVERVVTNSRLCLVGLRRNEATLEPHVYLDGLPEDLSGQHVVVCDPMLATGGSLIWTCSMVAARGAAKITALCLIASAEGLATFTAAHPDVHLVCAAVDPVLNEVGYIVPGLGDAGDRQFGPQARAD